ncbi:MAG TPA: S-adenosylmethionine:tRNA ribosyltransferase-isomerase [Solirubrobacteraceae bacterium]|nr:S-adenosylmethionine:tRNA ribosyltransferase-isomerase [Solirubrobacteraceae bacterium]
MSALAFELPAGLEATEPPEARGLARDEVRLMVATRSDGGIAHHLVRDLPDLLSPGDLLVVNVSATLPAALAARAADGTPLRLHASMPAPDAPAGEWWVVELRSPDGADPVGDRRAGERIALAGGAAAELVAPYGDGARLWLARIDARAPFAEHLARHGEPIRYGYVREPWPLEAYLTPFSTEPGSAEMPSAGRPLTADLLARLAARGVLVAPITLHTGVSSPERHEAPYPERYAVPATTARLVDAVRWWGGRIIAAGTTVVRALESAAQPGGGIEATAGWTSVVITPERGLAVVDGLLTGWHEPRASHLLMLEAVTGEALLARSYAAALEHGYLWHEFGDSHLVLP